MNTGAWKRGVVFIAAIVLIGITFLHWFPGVNFWGQDRSLHFKIGASLAVVVTAVVALLAIRGNEVLGRLAGVVALFAGGGVVFYALELSSYHPQAGVWAALVAGAVLAFFGLLIEVEGAGGVRAGRRAAPAQARAAAQPAQTVPQPAQAAAQPAQPAQTAAAQTAQAATAGGAMAPPKASDLTEPVQKTVPAGWYPDPSGEHEERLWDGTAWTHEVR